MSMSSSEVSQASTEVDEDTKAPDHSRYVSRHSIRQAIQSAKAQDVLLFLVAFRILNALTIQTFFQPDEYFQSLEPAWQTAFGQDSGAWITWEWKNQLRSAVHPAIFAAIYKCVDIFAHALRLSDPIRADIFLAAPKTIQAVFAAIGDYYTWKLAQRIYGHESNEAWAALALTVISPWQWFCSTRTLSNCLETSLTIVALYNWPWHWSLSSEENKTFQVDGEGLRIRDVEVPSHGSVDETTRLRRSIFFACIASILRPTNALIWISLGFMTLLGMTAYGPLPNPPKAAQSAWFPLSSLSLVPSNSELRRLIRESAVCATLVLALSVFIDRFYYQIWTFPPLNFIYFNVVQSLAVFYGKNDWHYYLSQGYPLLLTTALPFSILGIYGALHSQEFSSYTLPTAKVAPFQLAIISVLVPGILSSISHKEVRFIYPLLPLLHIISAPPISKFFYPCLTSSISFRRLSTRAAKWSILLKRVLLATLLTLNFIIAFYTSTVHNSGLIDMTKYLRQQHESFYSPSNKIGQPPNMTVAFLMPCHSTPWRSHLLYPPSLTSPGISAWALTCEPPLHLNGSDSATGAARAAYMDEADVFYANPTMWFRRNMSRHPPRPRGVFGYDTVPRRRDIDAAYSRRREWPDYLVFFEQLESVMHSTLAGSGYEECWRGFNTHWHDDWRRKGDVIVWCLYPERQVANKQHHDPLRALNQAWGNVSSLANNLKLKIWPSSSQPDGTALGGGMGPWGIGGDSVVEKSFWKRRPKAPVETFPQKLWGWLWPFPDSKSKKRGWLSGGGGQWD